MTCMLVLFTVVIAPLGCLIPCRGAWGPAAPAARLRWNRRIPAPGGARASADVGTAPGCRGFRHCPRGHRARLAGVGSALATRVTLVSAADRPVLARDLAGAIAQA